jgi:hypothetical protein
MNCYYKCRIVKISRSGNVSVSYRTGCLTPDSEALFAVVGNLDEAYLKVINRWNSMSSDNSGIYYTYWRYYP